MKILSLFIFLLPSVIYSQTDSINCEKLYYSFGCMAVLSMPEMIGGLDSLQMRLKYPKEAWDNNIQGKVYVQCIIDTLGFPICAKVVKGLGYGCDQEALKLVLTSHFIPAIQRNHRYVQVPVSIPVIFKIL
jgi:protein TonB